MKHADHQWGIPTISGAFRLSGCDIVTVHSDNDSFWDYECSEEQCFDDYATELRTLADVCEFEERENMTRNKIVFSMKDKRIQERLLREV